MQGLILAKYHSPMNPDPPPLADPHSTAPLRNGVSSSGLHFRSGCLFLVLSALLVFGGAMDYPRTPAGYLIPIPTPLLIVVGVVMLICIVLGIVQLVRA